MSARRRAAIQVAAVALGLVPLAAIGLRAVRSELGANPIAEALNRLGLSALVFLLLSLACTPAKTLLGWTWPAVVRRMLGLYAFTYATFHFATYLFLDQGGKLGAVVADIVKRPFILVGFLAWLLLVPLAATSTKKMVQRLGFKRWKALHRLVYAIATLGVIHFVLRVKKDTTVPVAYGVVLALLLGVRVLDGVKLGRRQAPAK